MAVVTVIESRSRGITAILAVAGGRCAVSTPNGKMTDRLSACGHKKDRPHLVCTMGGRHTKRTDRDGLSFICDMLFECRFDFVCGVGEDHRGEVIFDRLCTADEFYGAVFF